MTQVSLYYTSTQRLSCDCVLPAQVILCVPQSIVAPRPDLPLYEFSTIEASVTARLPASDACGGSYQRYTISYDDTQLVDQVPLRADQILGVLCKGCLTNWVEETAGNEVSVIDNPDSSQSLVSQHGEVYPLVVTSQNLINCEYVASQFGGYTQTAIINAIAAIGGASARLYIDCGAWAITANQVIPANIEVVVLEGALLTISAGVTLTINGPFAAPSVRVFAVPPTSLVSFGDGSVTAANSLWFGVTLEDIQRAVNSYRSVVVPKGTYAGTTEVVVTNPKQQLEFRSATLNAGVNGMTVIRWSSSNGSMRGPVTIDGNGFTGVSGIRVAPVNEGSVVTLTTIDSNSFSDIVIQNTEEGIVLAEGPFVGGVTSVTSNNLFNNIVLNNTNRGVFLKTGPNLGSAGCNNNSFVSVNVKGTGNVGFQIDNGSNNSFTSCSIVGRAFGITPVATPTGILLVSANGFLVPNNYNSFTAISVTSSTLDFSNNNTTTSVFGCTFTTVALLARPRALFGGDILTVPINFQDAFALQDSAVFPGQIVGFNINRNLALINGREMYDYDVPWTTYNLVLANITNASAISNQRCKYKLFNRFAHILLQFNFVRLVAGNTVDIDFPPGVFFNNALYIGGGNDMAIPGVVQTGGITSPQAMTFLAANKLRVYAPSGGGWQAGQSSVFVEFECRL